MYGIAEFVPGMEEVEAPIAATTTAPVAAAPTTVIPIESAPEEQIQEPDMDSEDAEDVGYTFVQKGLVLAVVVGGIAFYVRMNNRKNIKYKAIV